MSTLKIFEGNSQGGEMARLEMEKILLHYANQLPRDKMIEAILAVRNVIGATFPGDLPAGLALTLAVCISANAVAGIIGEMEDNSGLDAISADGRRQAIKDYFCRVINSCTDAQMQQRVRRALAKPPESLLSY